MSTPCTPDAHINTSTAAAAPQLRADHKEEQHAQAAADEQASPSAARVLNHHAQIVTPYMVKGGSRGIDYMKLVRDFGAQLIDPKLIDRVEKLTKRKAHHLLRRGIFFSHRDLETVLDLCEQGTPFYLYTGRGPSSKQLHIGHLVPFMFTQYLQEAFGAVLVVQLTDDEKFFWKNLQLAEAHALAFDNAKDIIACGFDVHRTFIFRDLDYIGPLYPVVCKIQKAVTFNQAKGIFGFTGGNNLGTIAFPAVQAAPAFSHAFPQLFGARADTNIPCLVPCAIDQDPYFRMARDVAHALGFRKPALMHSKFVPSLLGVGSKMSASDGDTSIKVTDTPEAVDVACQYLSIFMEDDEKLARVLEDYKVGKLLSGQLKALLVQEMLPIIERFQARRAAVTDDVVREFMRPRLMRGFGGGGADACVLSDAHVAR